MPSLALDKVEVYIFRRRRGQVQFLALRRAPGRRLAGVWQPVTGKVERRESIVRAALREVHEETGLWPQRWWRLESLTLYLDPEREQLVALPLLAAQVAPRAEVRLSREHDAARWVGARAAGRLYLWDSQRRALAAVRRQVLAGGEHARALAVTPSRPRVRARSKHR